MLQRVLCWKHSPLLIGDWVERIRLKLDPSPPPRGLQIWRLKIDKVQQDAARLQAVVVKKQDELRQAEERAENKSKEVSELHAEMLQVKKEMDQAIPQQLPPPPPASVPTIVPLEEEDDGDDEDFTPWLVMTTRFVASTMVAAKGGDRKGGEVRDDCNAQVKRARATPLPAFDAHWCGTLLARPTGANCAARVHALGDPVSGDCGGGRRGREGGSSIVTRVQEDEEDSLDCGDAQKQKEKLRSIT